LIGQFDPSTVLFCLFVCFGRRLVVIVLVLYTEACYVLQRVQFSCFVAVVCAIEQRYNIYDPGFKLPCGFLLRKFLSVGVLFWLTRSACCCYLDFREALPAIIISCRKLAFASQLWQGLMSFALFEHKIEVDLSADWSNISEKVELEGECQIRDP